MLVLEGFLDHLPIGGHQLPGRIEARPQPTGLRPKKIPLHDCGKEPSWRGRRQKSFENSLIQLRPPLHIAAVGHGIARTEPGDTFTGFFDRPMEGNPLAGARHRVVGPRVHLDVFEPVLFQLQLGQHRSLMNHDVDGRPHIEAETGNQIVPRANRATRQLPLFHHRHFLSGFRQIAGANQAVVPGPDDHCVVTQSILTSPRPVGGLSPHP